MNASPAFSVVVPVYRNRDSLPDVVKALEQLQGDLGVEVEAVFVIDGSPDDSLQVLRGLLPSAGVQSQLISHSRNFGAFAAIRTGFMSARGAVIAAMAADLQEPIELIADLYRQVASGEYDVAVGARRSRKDPAVTKFLSNAYWRTYKRFVQSEIPRGGVDVFACTRQVAETLGQFVESNSSLIGQLYWVGYRRVEVPYGRVEREHGKSSWTLRKRIKYMLDSVFSFTDLPISMILAVGMIGTVLALTGAFVVLISWIAGAITVPGYTVTMIVLLLAASSILFALGLVGTYVWRTYENTKMRPNAIVMARETFRAES